MYKSAKKKRFKKKEVQPVNTKKKRWCVDVSAIGGAKVLILYQVMPVPLRRIV